MTEKYIGTGWICQISDEYEFATISETKHMTAKLGLIINNVITKCENPDCGCSVEIFDKVFNDSGRILQIAVMEINMQ